MLIALYDTGVPFEPKLIDLGDPAERAAFKAVWPLAKFPVLRDAGARADRAGIRRSSSTIWRNIIRLRRGWSRPTRILPDRVRLLDRLIDSYIHLPFQQIVNERMRPEDRHDPFGAEQARDDIRQGYDLLAPMIAGPWGHGARLSRSPIARHFRRSSMPTMRFRCPAGHSWRPISTG